MRIPRSTPDATAARLPAPPARGRRAHAGPPAEEDPADAPAPAAAPVPATGGGPRLRLRPATVRAKIVSLLMVPVVSLLALWAFATVSTAQDIARLSRVQRIDTEVRAPLTRTIAELQAERRAAVRFLADPGAERAAGLQAQARRTDSAVRELRLGDRHTVADAGDYPGDVAVRLGAFVSATEALGPARTEITDRRATPDAAYETYTKIVDAALAVGGALAAGQDTGAADDPRVLLEFARAGELLAREDALLAVPGQRSTETLRRFTGAAETRRTLVEATTRDLPGAQEAAWRAIAKSAAYAELVAAEDRVLGLGTGKDARGAPTGWDAAYTTVGGAMRDIENAGYSGYTGTARPADPLAEGLLGPAGAAVLLGLAAVAASLVISVRIGRGLVVELVSLRNSALEIAHRKLPHAMDRLRAGQDIDIAAEAPPGRAAEDEIAQVGEALSTVHRAALGAAAERAELASGISGVFVNLARRSQVLVHRQLTLLDAMERRADDPGELGDLFRLDHLTTRMRRHAESLIILSGAAPGRAWRMPVPLTNVVRAAVSEIEDYPRVEVGRLAEAAVVGAAVADLTHLLAELIENATQFSPPHTKVRVSGEPVGTGYVLEVEDRGLGMGSGTLADANRRIEQSEALDLFDSDRLGLFVVSRLAARHGVKVHLRTSPYGGTTAVVLMPNSLLQGAITAGTSAKGAPAEGAPAEGGSAKDGSAKDGSAEDGSVHGAPVRDALVRDGSVLGGVAQGGAVRGRREAPEPALYPRADRAPYLKEPAGAAPSSEPAPAWSGEPGTPAVPVVRREPRPAPVATLRPRRPIAVPAPAPAPPAPAPPAPASPAPGPASAPGLASVPGPAAPSGPPRPSRPEPVPADVAELPRRVRQASLVPQLREVPAPRPAAAAAAPAGPPGRSPEEARARMAAYRAGWVRGTEDDSTPAGSEGEQR
ncbi:nitrate- and nitrite sensing domain-containing protein [Streptomyces sp. NPDC090022]|uniref:sensor histidine kinase n=1 Tax=Streptomyces sp. NPDC090022 TaxID=3365920 RepID=UPI003817A133